MGLAVHDVGDQRRELDRVLLVLEELRLERLVQPLVGAEVELLALDRERTDEVHDLATEVILSALRDAAAAVLLLDGPHQPLIRLLVLPREGVPDALLLRIGLHVVDVVSAQARDGVLVR